jgi:hypothetical protein
MLRSIIAWTLMATASSALPLAAQTVTWQVVAGENSQIIAPDLPAGITRNLTDVWVGDTGASLFGFRATSPSASEGYWASRSGRLVRYTQLSSNGTLGPGRGGAEAAHVFLSINSGWGGASSDGQRNILARAADPAATLNASYGLWRWDGTRNVEVARASTDGILGPGLGAGTVFQNSGSFATARMLNGGSMLISANVTSPTGVDSQLVARHVPGLGNRPCSRSGSTDPSLSPGLAAGDTFFTVSSGIGRMSVTPAGQIHARLTTAGSREGIWELCNGAPRAIAVDNETGPRGPDVGISTALFSSFAFQAPQPSASAGTFFFADWRDPPQGSRTALFRHDGISNRGIAFNEPSGYFGPNWLSATWRSFSTDSLSVAYDYAAFVADVNTPDGGTPVGLWRVRAGDRPELKALIGLIGAPYEPEPGRSWRSFDAVAALSNGDIVLEATTNPNSTKDLWLLRAGQAPTRLLSLGQNIAVPTTQGNVQASISSFDVLDDGANYSNGTDTWIAADGTLYVSANTTNLGRILITTRLTVPNPDIVFANGLEASATSR